MWGRVLDRAGPQVGTLCASTVHFTASGLRPQERTFTKTRVLPCWGQHYP